MKKEQNAAQVAKTTEATDVASKKNVYGVVSARFGSNKLGWLDVTSKINTLTRRGRKIQNSLFSTVPEIHDQKQLVIHVKGKRKFLVFDEGTRLSL